MANYNQIICPIFYAMALLEDTRINPKYAECHKEECALWDKKKCECIMFSIGESIKYYLNAQH